MSFIYRWLGKLLERTAWGRGVVALVRRFPKTADFCGSVFEIAIFYFFISTFIVQAFEIPSSSMEPTLKVGDRILVNKFIYWFTAPRVGDIVVFKTPKKIYEKDKPLYIKRVAGLPQDIVEIKFDRFHNFGHLYNNGKPVTEPQFMAHNSYSPFVRNLEDSRKVFYQEQVPVGEIYVFGDNSRNSYDSRFWGGFPEGNLKGKAFFCYWPPRRIGLVK